MAYSEDHIALAAEYALGTLDAEERAQVEAMMSVDKDFTTMVQAWQYKLGVLNQMVGSVEPRPLVWDNIRAAIGHAAPQAPLVLPEPEPPVAAVVEPATTVVEDSNVIAFSTRAKRWRNVASFTSAIAAALVAMVAVQAFRPDLLPAGLRPKPASNRPRRSTGPRCWDGESLWGLTPSSMPGRRSGTIRPSALVRSSVPA